MHTVARSLKRAADFVQKAAPYLVVELVLPGGTLVALLLFLRRHRRSTYPHAGTMTAVFEHTLGAVRGGLVPAPWRRGASRGVDVDDGLAPLALAPGP